MKKKQRSKHFKITGDFGKIRIYIHLWLIMQKNELAAYAADSLFFASFLKKPKDIEITDKGEVRASI